LIHYFYKKSDVVVAICSAIIESARKSGIDEHKIIYIPHGVDTELYRPVDAIEKNRLRESLGLQPHKRYLIFVGSAIRRKGIDVITDAFIRIRSQLDDLELLIVGPDNFNQRGIFDAGDKKNVIQECKKTLLEASCSDAVHWLGEVNNVHEYMKIADLFCLPTRQEGFGIVIIEAMASGLPVVVSRLEGITTDIVYSDYDGILIDGHQASDYAEALLLLLNRPERLKQLSASSRERAVSVFGMESALAAWTQLFENLSAGRQEKK
jgi:glycosyltransferase involved in cell wall biosynthesis